MKTHFYIIAMVILGMAFVSCTIHIDGETQDKKTVKGNGNIVTQTYDVSAFDEISASLSATVNYTVSNDYTCTVRVDENLLEYIDIAVKGDDLILKKQEKHKNINLRATEFVIDITAPSLDEVSLAGSGDFNFITPLNENELEVSVAGAGNIKFNEETNVNHLELNVAGSGDIYIARGTIRELEADIAGSGKIVSYADVQELEADVAGSGDITAKVNGKLKYFIAGSGDIKYYGDAVLEGKVMGSGNIQRIEPPAQ